MMPLPFVAPVPVGVASVLVWVGWVPWLLDDPVLPAGDPLRRAGALLPGYGLAVGGSPLPMCGLTIPLFVRRVLPPPCVALIRPSALGVSAMPRLAVAPSAALLEVASVVRVMTGTAGRDEGGVDAVVVVSVLRALAKVGFDFGPGWSGNGLATAVGALFTVGAVARRLGGLLCVRVVTSAIAAIAAATINATASNRRGR
jgi:hypothetical protein